MDLQCILSSFGPVYERARFRFGGDIVNKTKAKGTQWGRVLSMAAGVTWLVVMSGGLQATPLWSNCGAVACSSQAAALAFSYNNNAPSDNSNSGYFVFDSVEIAPVSRFARSLTPSNDPSYLAIHTTVTKCGATISNGL